MAGSRAQQRLILTLIVLLVAAIAAFQVFKRPVYRLFGDFFSPYLAVPAAADAWVSETVDQFKSREVLLNENRRLRNENERLWSARHELESLRSQYGALRRLLDLPPLYGYKYQRGQVILRDPSAWDTVLTVNIGKRAGVRPGYPVLTLAPQRVGNTTQDCLVVIGRVESVSENTAVVRTLIHPESNLSVFMPGAAVAAMLRGGQANEKGASLTMRYLPRPQKLTENEPVYTSGLAPYTPEGLLVGYIQRNEDGETVFTENRLDASATVRHAADISALRFVVIPVPAHATESER